MNVQTASPRIQEFDDPNYDPFSADDINFGDIADPYPKMHELRAKGAVHEGSYRELMGLPYASTGDYRTFMVVGTLEIEQVFADPETFSNTVYVNNVGLSFGRAISAMDDPEHIAYRQIFQKAFLPQYVREWGTTIVDPVVRSVMAAFLPEGKADLIAQFTRLYPFEVIYAQLDLPREDVRIFHRLAIGQTDFVNIDKAIEAGKKLGKYFRGLVDKRRQRPRNDLISILSQSEVDGEYLPEEVLISFLRQLMNAAGDTTYRGTSVLLTALLRNIDQLEALRANRDLIPRAIEEALRWDGPVAVLPRLVLKDVELGGTQIPAGSVVDIFSGAANRDPKIWPDPDKFDILRDPKAHFAFARGGHICIGRHLARIEMTRALNAILDKMPNLRCDPDLPPAVIQGCLMRVPRHLHVTFDPIA